MSKGIFLVICGLLLGANSKVFAAPAINQSADSVIGQPDLDSSETADPPTVSSVRGAVGLCIDFSTGKLFVMDSGNNRILRFAGLDAYRDGADAEAVFGQGDFGSRLPNRGGMVTASGLSSPQFGTVDGAGRLWVVDHGNFRLLRFDDASNKVSGGAADGVLGQPDSDSNTRAPASGDHTNFRGPRGVAVDAAGNVYVSDEDLNRILRFDNAASKDPGDSADVVIGQPDFATFISGTSSNTFDSPYDICIDRGNRLWVADRANQRVLRFSNPGGPGNQPGAAQVLGQDNFESSSAGLSNVKFDDPFYLDLSVDGILWVSDYSNNRVVGFANAATKPFGAAMDFLLGQPDFDSSDSVPVSGISVEEPEGVASGLDGSVFVIHSTAPRVLRFSSPVKVASPRVVRTRRKRARVSGTSSGAYRVRYRVSGQRGLRKARGTAQNWRVIIRGLKRKRTVVRILALSFDGRSSFSKTRVLRKGR